MRRKLAIVGLGHGKDNAPDATWGDIWRCNPGCWLRSDTRSLSLVDTSLWFEIHTRRYLTETHGESYARLATGMLNLTKQGAYFLDPNEWPEVRQRKMRFPRARIARAFPRGDYHAGSFDWMLAFALLENYQHIEIFGVDLGPTDTGEPISARPCLEYWCGIAAGRGVEVVSHSPSLFRIFNYQRASTPYHYDDTWRLVEDRHPQ